MRDKFIFSDSQALGTLDTTGVVSTNIFDLEVAASGGAAIITDDQIEGYLNILITAAPTTQTGAEGMFVDLRTDDTSTLAFGAAVYPTDATADEHILGMIHIKEDDMRAGKKWSIKVLHSKMGKYLGVWYRAASTGLATGVTVDAWLSDQPVSENEDIQKVPSR
jgi:hypothetical protein